MANVLFMQHENDDVVFGSEADTTRTTTRRIIPTNNDIVTVAHFESNDIESFRQDCARDLRHIIILSCSSSSSSRSNNNTNRPDGLIDDKLLNWSSFCMQHNQFHSTTTTTSTNPGGRRHEQQQQQSLLQEICQLLCNPTVIPYAYAGNVFLLLFRVLLLDCCSTSSSSSCSNTFSGETAEDMNDDDALVVYQGGFDSAERVLLHTMVRLLKVVPLKVQLGESLQSIIFDDPMMMIEKPMLVNRIISVLRCLVKGSSSNNNKKQNVWFAIAVLECFLRMLRALDEKDVELLLTNKNNNDSQKESRRRNRCFQCKRIIPTAVEEQIERRRRRRQKRQKRITLAQLHDEVSDEDNTTTTTTTSLGRPTTRMKTEDNFCSCVLLRHFQKKQTTCTRLSYQQVLCRSRLYKKILGMLSIHQLNIMSPPEMMMTRRRHLGGTILLDSQVAILQVVLRLLVVVVNHPQEGRHNDETTTFNSTTRSHSSIPCGRSSSSSPSSMRLVLLQVLDSMGRQAYRYVLHWLCKKSIISSSITTDTTSSSSSVYLQILVELVQCSQYLNTRASFCWACLDPWTCYISDIAHFYWLCRQEEEKEQNNKESDYITTTSSLVMKKKKVSKSDKQLLRITYTMLIPIYLSATTTTRRMMMDSSFQNFLLNLSFAFPHIEDWVEEDDDNNNNMISRTVCKEMLFGLQEMGILDRSSSTTVEPTAKEANSNNIVVDDDEDDDLSVFLLDDNNNSTPNFHDESLTFVGAESIRACHRRIGPLASNHNKNTLLAQPTAMMMLKSRQKKAAGQDCATITTTTAKIPIMDILQQDLITHIFFLFILSNNLEKNPASLSYMVGLVVVVVVKQCTLERFVLYTIWCSITKGSDAG